MNTKPIYKSPAGKREIMAFYDAALERPSLFNVDAAAKRLQKLVPQARVVIIPEMDHALLNLSEQIMPFLTA